MERRLWVTWRETPRRIVLAVLAIAFLLAIPVAASGQADGYGGTVNLDPPSALTAEPVYIPVQVAAADGAPEPPAPLGPAEAPPASPSPSDTPALTPQPEPDACCTQPQRWNQSVPPYRCGVACPVTSEGKHDSSWKATGMIPWQVFAHGEYIGPARTAHVPEYCLRVDDIIRFVYGLTGAPSARPYELEVGDLIRIESVGSPKLNREVLVQPDGAVTLLLLGQVSAAGLSIEQFRGNLEQAYTQFVRDPQISVTPVKINTRVEELRMAVDERYGKGGQGVTVRVTPAGTIQLPSIGSVPVQGLSLHEVEREVEARYNRRFHGIDVTPILEARAPRFVYVLGEVRLPGRYELEGPTTVMQAIAMAGSWNVGAKLHHIVVFRRDECWGLMATRLDLHRTLFGKEPCPVDEIWLRDSDVILVPKSDLLATDDWIFLVFTRGIYGAMPFNYSFGISAITSL